MAREPVAGRVKSRLARSIGAVEALRFYRGAVRAVIVRLARQPFWQTLIAVAPDAALRSRAFPPHARLIKQGGGDLGQRMQRPMRQLPPGPVCVIGTDVPAIEVGDVRRAFRLLGAADMVFGPAADGGFWLVGARRRPRVIEPYAGVRWSRPATLAQVLANLSPHKVALTTGRSDVDEREDLQREGPYFARVVRPSQPPPSAIPGLVDQTATDR
jgi:hypothetical protein